MLSFELAKSFRSEAHETARLEKAQRELGSKLTNDNVPEPEHMLLHSFQKAKFQIGSVKGIKHYDKHDRVFHHSDIPFHAQQARDFVTKFKLGKLENGTLQWDASTSNGADCHGRLIASWEEEAAHWEDRQYKQLEAQNYIDRAQARLKQKVERVVRERMGLIDPSGQWNNSTAVANNKSFQTKSVPKSRSPTNHQSPIDRVNAIAENQRLLKTQQLANNTKRAQWTDSSSFLHSFPQDPFSTHAHVSSSSEPSEVPTHPVNTAETSRAATTGLSVNRHVLHTQDREPDERAKQALKPKKLRYEHSGVWMYSKESECDVWSCCMAYQREAAGCTTNFTQHF